MALMPHHGYMLILGVAALLLLILVAAGIAMVVVGFCVKSKRLKIAGVVISAISAIVLTAGAFACVGIVGTAGEGIAHSTGQSQVTPAAPNTPTVGLQPLKAKIKVTLNHEALSAHGVRPEDAQKAVQRAIDSDPTILQPGALGEITVPAGDGHVVRLKDIATIEIKDGQ